MLASNLTLNRFPILQSREFPAGTAIHAQSVDTRGHNMRRFIWLSTNSFCVSRCQLEQVDRDEPAYKTAVINICRHHI